MIYYILLLLIFLMCAFLGHCYFCDEGKIINAILGTIGGILFSAFIVTAFYTIILLIIGGITLPNTVYESNIYSLNKQDTINGSFFLGTGNIKQTKYYYFYKQTGEDEYILRQSKCSDTYIVETDKVEPKIEYYFAELSNKFGPKWLIKIGDTFIKAKLYVPKGTIIKEFKV